MTNITTTRYLVLIFSILIGALLFSLYQAKTTHANVITQGIIGQVASSSLMSVGPGNSTTLFAKNSNCTTRIVSTGPNAIMLSFTSSLTPTGTTGHVQAASTTIAYENGTYGCGQLSAYGFTSSSSLTVTQLTQ